MNLRSLIIFTLIMAGIAGCSQQEKPNTIEIESRKSNENDWKSHIKDKLKVYGHRNWIVVADAAYPQQSNPAIQTMTIDAGQLEAVEFVIDLINNSGHVDANIFVDKEMAYVAEKNANGIEAYRNDLNKVLDGKPVKAMLHEEIINQLDKSAELFNVFILKTDLTIPYTSVFFQLECGYWDAASEGELRDLLNKNI